MKMSREDYQELQRMLKDTMSRQPEHMNTWEKIKAFYIEKKLGKDHVKRARWDIASACACDGNTFREFLDRQYDKGLNDKSFDTALHRAVKELK